MKILDTAVLLQANGTFQYLTGLPRYPDPQTLRRFLLHAPPEFRQQLHRFNDRLLRRFIHQPEHRSRLILDLDSTGVTVFGRQEGAEVGYNPRYRGKRSYDPLLCLEANSSFLWDTELRPGNAGTWAGSDELLASCLLSVPADIRELREDYALRKIPTRAFAANALYLEVVRLAYNLVTAFQRTCLPEGWQFLTLSKLRHRLFWLPGELTRPQNRPALRLPGRPAIQEWTTHILHQVHKLKPLDG